MGNDLVVEKPEFYVATLGTRHYDWLGVGFTEKEALAALKARFFETNELDEAEWLEEWDVEEWAEHMAPRIQKVHPGEGYLDGEDTDDYQRRQEDGG